MSNPYVIGFGMKPNQYVPRTMQREEIINAFNNDNAVNPAYLITGVRGSGKTVMLDEISDKIGHNWVVINLNSYSDLLQSLASKLYYHERLKKFFSHKKFEFSFSGLSVAVEENAPAPDYETVIEAMLKEVLKRELKVLVVIDEVTNTPEMRRFASSFQLFIRENLPIRLLMASLPENIYDLTKERRSTFLVRTPRMTMEPLNLSMIRHNYQRTLNVPQQIALQLASLTKGYSFAYQALGYVCWGRNVDPEAEEFEDILAEYDYYLQEYSYKKIWEVLSPIDRKVISAISIFGTTAKVKDIRNHLGMDSNKFTVYRSRIKNQGIIDTSSYGELSFSLPRFAEFVRTM